MLTHQGPLKGVFKRKLSKLIPQRTVLKEQREGGSEKIGDHAVALEASRKQRATTGFLHPLSCARPRASLLVKESCGTSQFCIPNNTVPIFASSVCFSPFSLLRFWQNRPSFYHSMVSATKKAGDEREDTDYDPEEEESETGTPKKGRKKKEKPDPALTMGTDIEHFLQANEKQLEIELSKVLMTRKR